MTMGVFDFKAINRKLNRQEQKAELDAKNPKPEPSMYGWPYGVAVPYGPFVTHPDILDRMDSIRERIERQQRVIHGLDE